MTLCVEVYLILHSLVPNNHLDHAPQQPCCSIAIAYYTVCICCCLLEKFNTSMKRIVEVSRDGIGPKSTQTRVVGIITDKMHPYTLFIETLLLENKMWGASCPLSTVWLCL